MCVAGGQAAGQQGQNNIYSGANLMVATIRSGQGSTAAKDWLQQFRQRFQQNHGGMTAGQLNSQRTVLGG
jgi:hypothetical protein